MARSRGHFIGLLGSLTLGLAQVALVVATALVLFIAYGLVDNRWYHVVAIDGGSMEPTIARGDLIVISRPPATVEPGMVLTLQVDGAVVTHRVVEVHADGTFVTKGDANTVRDDFSGNRVRVVGQYVARIPALGQLLSFDRHAPGLPASASWFGDSKAVDAVAEAGTWADGSRATGSASDDGSEPTANSKPAPDASSQPAPTVEGAPTPTPSAEATSEPGAAPTPEASPTPETSPTPEASATPGSSAEPSAQPEASASPDGDEAQPKATPQPTATAPPSEEPADTPTPEPTAEP